MSDALEIRAPAEQTEGTRSQVLRWLKAVGDRVSANEPLIEIETDKVTVEIAAPGSGILREILRQEQEEIEPGELLGRIDSAPGPAGPAAVGAAGPAAVGARGPAVGARGPAAVGAPEPAAAATPAAVAAAVSAAPVAAGSVSPAVRRLLAEPGLQASDVHGTGPGARVMVEDVLRAAAADSAAPTPTPTKAVTQTTTQAATQSVDASAGSRRVPHSAVRKRIAEHMVQSLLHTAPHVTTVFEANMERVLEHRQRHREEFARRGAPLTLTAYFLQATVAAIRVVPEANSRWTDTALEIFDSIHVGVATAVDTGLVVPVLHDVQSRDLFEIATGLDGLITRARQGRLAPADVRGGTFTISNHGVSGSLLAAPIVINQAQAAILGIGKLEKRAVVLSGDAVDGQGPLADRVVVQPRCYVTLTIDHRVMDGHQANQFLQTFVQWLESSQP